YQVEQLQAAGVDETIVVTGHECDRLRALLDGSGVRVTWNSRYREGRASSVRAGAACLPDEVGQILILSVDQPRPSPVSQRLLEYQRETGALICRPVFAGRHGHPLILVGALAGELRSLEEASFGLK